MINIGGVNANTIGSYSQRKGGSTGNPTNGPSGSKIGEARVYSFSVTDASYTNESTIWDLHLYDVQLYQNVTVSKYNNISAPIGSRVRGLSSGAIGYIASNPNPDELDITQTTGTFIQGERLIFNEEEKPRKSICNISSCI